MKTYVFLADGFEEVEALTPIDVLRRAGVDLTTVSIKDTSLVVGAHGVGVEADVCYSEVDFADAEWLVLPGGMPGAQNLYEHQALSDLLVKHHKEGKGIAAICASPAVVLAQLGLLQGKSATCYPGFDPMLESHGAEYVAQRVVSDGNIITGNGPASALPFALELATAIAGAETAASVAAGMLV